MIEQCECGFGVDLDASSTCPVCDTYMYDDHDAKYEQINEGN